MNQPHSFKQCYEILKIETDSDWNTVKKSYRRLIQKWHPDRQTEPKLKLEATNKIKDLNTAYTQISDYYRENGELPFTEQPEQIIEESHHDIGNTQEPTQKDDNLSSIIPEHDEQFVPNYAAENKNYKSSIFISIIVITLLVVIYQNVDTALSQIETEKVLAPPPQHRSEETKKSEDSKEIIRKKAQIKKKTSSKEKYFTYGSSLTDVISIQGPPDKTKGNIWYYGQSEVHFMDGKVSYWFRSADRPLKAIMMKRTPKVAEKGKEKRQLLQY